MRKRGQLPWQYFVPWIIAIVVLVLFIIIDIYLGEKGMGIIEFIARKLRIGR
jgi:hypothetical protein